MQPALPNLIQTTLIFSLFNNNLTLCFIYKPADNLFLSKIQVKMKNKVKSILSHLLLILFISYYGSITLFWHSHHLGNTIIVHSHPFNNAQHSHTTAQYDLIKVLTETAGFIGFIGLWVAGLLNANRLLFVSPSTSNALLFDSAVWYRRGPPQTFRA